MCLTMSAWPSEISAFSLLSKTNIQFNIKFLQHPRNLMVLAKTRWQECWSAIIHAIYQEQISVPLKLSYCPSKNLMAIAKFLNYKNICIYTIGVHWCITSHLNSRTFALNSPNLPISTSIILVQFRSDTS